jgi:hypothetical protein
VVVLCDPAHQQPQRSPAPPPAVCIAVVGKLKAAVPANDAKDLSVIESKLVNAVCGAQGTGSDMLLKGNLNDKEKKVCYSLIPIKREVSKLLVTGMGPPQVCNKLKKSSTEICSVKYGAVTGEKEESDGSAAADAAASAARKAAAKEAKKAASARPAKKAAEEPANASDYNKMKTKDLKALLQSRGIKCIGCAEKEDFIKKLRESDRDL